MTSIQAESSRPKPPVVQPSGNSIIINPCQRLNPLLECIRNVSKEFGDIAPDFQLGRTTCALFLSLKYHRLHPEYIHQRIQRLGSMYTLRILLLMCDVSEHQEPIRELTKICLLNNITVIVAWSHEEAGTYLATYKIFEHKPPDLIKERVDKEYSAVLRTALTSINKVNKMDVETLRTSFGSFAKIAHANPERLRSLPGFGPVKVRRLVDAFNKPFRNNATSAMPAAPAVLDDAASSYEEHAVAAAPSAPVPSAATGAVRASPTKSSAPRTAHSFGSAVDMPPPPGPLARRPSPALPRASSPVWDIELDLTEDDFTGAEAQFLGDSPMDSRSNVDGERLNVSRSPVIASGKKADNTWTGSPKPPMRSPSPVWDIELDLN